MGTHIGHGVEIEYWQSKAHNLRAVNVFHRKPDGSPCACCAYIKVPDEWVERPQLWTVRQMSPLTLDPSIVCRTCGLHGWIKDGKWHPA